MCVIFNSSFINHCVTVKQGLQKQKGNKIAFKQTNAIRDRVLKLFYIFFCEISETNYEERLSKVSFLTTSHIKRKQPDIFSCFVKGNRSRLLFFNIRFVSLPRNLWLHVFSLLSDFNIKICILRPIFFFVLFRVCLQCAYVLSLERSLISYHT